MIQTIEVLVQTAESDAKFAKDHYTRSVEIAQFWRRYAFEKTSDKPLRQIAENDLKNLQDIDVLFDSIVPKSLRDFADSLKDFSVTL
ncbi:MAG: hypothetical protein WEF53_13155 [Bacteroidota bacterium]